jgi:phosphoglycerate dehydrogenase-like enzyme
VPDRPVIVVALAESQDPTRELEPASELAELRFARTSEEFLAGLEAAEALLAWDFGRRHRLRESWSHAGGLRWIQMASAGYDAMLFDELASSDVVLTNARGVYERPMAEYVLGLLLLFAKDMHTTLAYQRERRWVPRESGMLAGRRLLVVGVGPVGRAIGEHARAIGMEVSGLGRRPRAGDETFARIGGAGDLDAFLAETDDVVIAAPLTPETHGLFDAGRLARLPRGARLINVGRGAIVDEAALLDALRSGHVSAAGLDVFATEPLPPESPFWALPQVVVSPHMSGDRIGWQEGVAAVFIENLRRWIAGEPLLHVVDKGGP